MANTTTVSHRRESDFVEGEFMMLVVSVITGSGADPIKE
jgi:hypothetical protein